MHTSPIYGIRFIEIYYLVPIRCICDMCALFRNRYVIGTKRYSGYDYSLPGKYFVTICTKNKIPYFGKIENGEMELSELGICLHNQLLKTPTMRPDMNIIIDEFVIMPDHLHAIIIIGNNRYNKQNKMNKHCRIAMHGDSTIPNNNYNNTFGPQIKNLSSIIRGIKSAVTIHAKKMKMEFAWQPRYYDRIIRNHSQLSRIKKYIRENPKNWKKSI